MSDFENKIVVLQDGQLKKIGSADNLSMGGGFTAGSLAGDGAGVTNIAQGNVVGLEGALSTLTSEVATANSNASAAVSTADTAAANASAAVADAAQAASDASAAATSAASAASDASSAASSASSAASSASAAQSDASAAAASALAAQGDASAAASSASSAASSASSAASDASAAATSASAAAADASTAQSAATASASDAAAAASDASNAAASALAAQGDASAAASSASSASTSASSAASSASSAASSASSAASDASAAAASAATAASDAASAISTANGAVTTADAAASDAASAVSTANSAASDASSALALAQDALPLSGGTLTGPLAGTDASFSGSLVVQGKIINKGEVDVLISDSFLDLNAGNVLSTPTAGGFTVNVQKASGFVAEEATAFVAGNADSATLPSMTISGSALAAGDIVQVSNSAGGKNDGLYVVAGKVGSVVSIKGIGGSMPSAQVPFVGNQFVASTGETAIVVKVDLAAIAVSNGSLVSASGAIAAGLLCYAYAAGATEAAFEGDWSVLASTASSSLQTAYNNGDGSIDLENGKDFEINGSADGSADVVLNPHIVIGSSIGQKKQVEAGVAAGDIVFLDSDGVCKKASSTSFSEALYVALEATGGAQALKKVDFLGEMKVGIVGTAPSIKDTLFLSETAGKASKVAPATGSVISLGACVGAAVGGLYPVRLQIGMPVAL